MSNPYIQKEVSKIVKDKTDSSKDLALASAWVLAHFKAINIKAYNVAETSSLCDYNVIASAENTTQARAMVEELIASLKPHEIEPISLEGMGEAEWILLDIGSVIVHVFQDVSRDVFDLDSLWESSPTLEIPNEYYFGSAEGADAPKTKDSTESYF